MMVGFIVAAAALAGAYLWYITLITRRNKVREAMSSVDVHLDAAPRPHPQHRRRWPVSSCSTSASCWPT